MAFYSRLRPLYQYLMDALSPYVGALKRFLEAHLLGAFLSIATITGVTGAFLFRKSWLPVIFSKLPRAILHALHGHPHLLRILHVAIDAIPDIAYLLMTLAGFSFLMPNLIKKIEGKFIWRLSAFVLLASFGITTVILNAINREAQGQKDDKVQGSLQEVLRFLVTSKGSVPNELERRQRVLEMLKNEYIIANPNAPSSIVTGNALPPDAWTNMRLGQLGEQWKAKSVQPVTTQLY